MKGPQIVIRTSNSESHGVVRRIAASLLFLGFSLFLALFTAMDVEMWTMTLVEELWWWWFMWLTAWCRNRGGGRDVLFNGGARGKRRSFGGLMLLLLSGGDGDNVELGGRCLVTEGTLIHRVEDRETDIIRFVHVFFSLRSFYFTFFFLMIFCFFFQNMLFFFFL